MRTIYFVLATVIYLVAALLVALIANDEGVFFWGVAMLVYPIILGWWLWLGTFVVLVFVDVRAKCRLPSL